MKEMIVFSVYFNVFQVLVYFKPWHYEHALLLFHVEGGILIHQHACLKVWFS